MYVLIKTKTNLWEIDDKRELNNNKKTFACNLLLFVAIMNILMIVCWH